MRNILTLIGVSLVLTSCGNDKLDQFEGRLGSMTPRPMYFSEMPQGSDSYSQGLRDGCNSALSTISQGLQRTNFDDIYLDPNRTIKDEEYGKGWQLGNNYCTYYNDSDVI